MIRKLRRRMVLIIPGVLLAVGASSALMAMPVDNYLALRKKLCSASVTVASVSQDPYAHRGSTFELRGKVSGVAKNANGGSVILSTAAGCYVLAADKNCDVQSGTQVCALVGIGENNTVNLSDLRLVAAASLSEVTAAEQRWAAEQKKATERKLASKQALTKTNAASTPRGVRSQNLTYRGVEGIYDAYRKAVSKFNKKLSVKEVDAITASILEFSRRENVDPRFVMAVILAESHFNPNATSRAGAMGLGQLMPGTAKGLGVSNAYDPVANIEGAVRLIKGHLTKYSGSSDWNDLDWSHIQLALASYNAGPGAVKKYGGVPPYRETQGYIRKVVQYYKELCGID